MEVYGIEPYTRDSVNNWRYCENIDSALCCYYRKHLDAVLFLLRSAVIIKFGRERDWDGVELIQLMANSADTDQTAPKEQPGLRIDCMLADWWFKLVGYIR